MSRPARPQPALSRPARPAVPPALLRVVLVVAGVASAPACQDYDLKPDTDALTEDPRIEVTPDALAFGPHELGDAATLPVTVRNVGGAALEVRSLELAGTGAGAFTLVGDVGPFTLAPGAGQAVDVVYTATSAATEATLYVHSDDPSTPDLPVPLTGETVYGAIVEDPSPVDFGAVPYVDPASGDALPVVERTLTLRNVGAATATVSNWAIVGDAFDLPAPPALPWSLAPGESTALTLTFTPPAVGLTQGELWVEADDAVGSHLVRLLGTGAVDGEDEQVDDPCYEPEDAYDPHPGARLVLEDTAVVALTYLGSYAGYENELWVEAPDVVFLANNRTTATGLELDVGPVAAGEELVLGLHVISTRDEYLSGPGDRNRDRQIHAAVTYRGDCAWLVGFEDVYGGGDRDYNDMSLLVEGPLRLE